LDLRSKELVRSTPSHTSIVLVVKKSQIRFSLLAAQLWFAPESFCQKLTFASHARIL